MKNTLKAFLIVCIATVCLGFAFKHYANDDAKYEYVIVHERIHTGDTFNGVIQHYYNPKYEKEAWNEWQTKMKNRNKALFFYENGKARWLRSGDIVCIKVRVPKKR